MDGDSGTSKTGESKEKQPGRAEDEEDVIPSSQGEFFSSQSSTPDMVMTPSELLPVLQPSQSTSYLASSPGTAALRISDDLIPGTPCEAAPSAAPPVRAPSAPVVLPTLDISSSSSTACEPDCQTSTPQQAAPSTSPQIHLDYSASPSVCDVSVDVPPAKRPLSLEEEAATPSLKRPRTSAADDSDIQIVDEVRGDDDCRMVFSPQEGGFMRRPCPVVTLTPEQDPGADVLAVEESQELRPVSAGDSQPDDVTGAESQAAFSLRYSQSQTESALPALVAVETRLSPTESRATANSEETGRLTIDTQYSASHSQPSGQPIHASEGSAVERGPALPDPTSDGDTSAQEWGVESELRRPGAVIAVSAGGGSDVGGPQPADSGPSLERQAQVIAAAVGGGSDVEGPLPADSGRSEERQAQGSADRDEENVARAEGVLNGTHREPAADGSSQSSPGSKASQEKLSNGKSPVPSPAVSDKTLPPSQGTPPEYPYQFHATQSQSTQTSGPLQPPPAIRGPELVSDQMWELFKRGMRPILKYVDVKTGQEVDLSEHLLQRHLAGLASTASASTSTSTLSTSRSGSTLGSGYAADQSTSSGSSYSKRLSTLTSATLSTIDGRGARHSVGSSIDADAQMLRRRRQRESVISVQADSPGSAGSDVEELPPTRAVPEFVSPHGRPPRAHGQPSAVSSVISTTGASGGDSQETRGALARVISGLESPPAATSTQAEASPTAGPSLQPMTPSQADASSMEVDEPPVSRTGRGGRGTRGVKKVSFSRRRGSKSGTVTVRAGEEDADKPGEDITNPPAICSAPTPDKSEKHSSEETHVTNTTSGDSGSPEVGRVPTPQPDLAEQVSRLLSDEEEAELTDREMSALRRDAMQPGQPCFALWVDKTYYPGRLVSEQRDGRWLVAFDDGTRREVPTAHLLPVNVLWKGMSVFVQRDEGGFYESAIITGHRVSSMEGHALEYIVSLDSLSVTCAVPRSQLLLSRDQAAVMIEARAPADLALGSPARALSLDNVVSGRRRGGAGPARRLPGFDTSSGQDISDDAGRKRTQRERDVFTPSTKGRAARAKSTPGPASDAAAASPVSRRGARAKSTGTPAKGVEAATGATPSGRGRKRPAASTPEDQTSAATPSGRRGKRSASAKPAAAPPSPGQAESATTAASKESTASSARRKAKQRRPSKALEAAASAAADDTSEPELVRPLDQFPLAKSDLFKDLTVILTGASGLLPSKWKQKYTRDPPYDKCHVAEHVQCRGGQVISGTVLRAADVRNVRGTGDILLLSNGPVRTPKYITCLAMGVPCVTLRWLVDSISKDERLPYEDFLLPAGGYPGREVCEQVLHAPPPLASLRALVADDADSDWSAVVTNILAAAGAEVKCDVQDPGAAAVPFPAEVVVARQECPEAVLSWAAALNVPVVSPEWVIACVISNSRLACSARPEFGHTYLVEDTSVLQPLAAAAALSSDDTEEL